MSVTKRGDKVEVVSGAAGSGVYKRPELNDSAAECVEGDGRHMCKGSIDPDLDDSAAECVEGNDKHNSKGSTAGTDPDLNDRTAVCLESYDKHISKGSTDPDLNDSAADYVVGSDPDINDSAAECAEFVDKHVFGGSSPDTNSWDTDIYDSAAGCVDGKGKHVKHCKFVSMASFKSGSPGKAITMQSNPISEVPFSGFYRKPTARSPAYISRKRF